MKKLKERPSRKMSARTVVFTAFLTLVCAGTVFGQESGWWVNESDGWYYSLPDGTLATGWIQVDGMYYFLSDTGRCLIDTMTPDGYYVDGNGAWYQRDTRILGIRTLAPEQFLPLSTEWSKNESLAALQYMIKEVFGNARQLRMSDSAIEYISFNMGTSANGKQTGKVQETVLCGMYKEPEQGRYRFDIRMNLNPERTDGRTAATYDYEIFRTLIYQISSAPEMLEEALYSAWQGENTWKIQRDSWVNIGDSQVIYTAGNGFGRFYISKR